MSRVFDRYEHFIDERDYRYVLFWGTIYWTIAHTMSQENVYRAWMGNLPPEKTRVPLCSLAIPGKNQRERTPKSHRRNWCHQIIGGHQKSSFNKIYTKSRFTTSWTFFDAFRIIKKNHADTWLLKGGGGGVKPPPF